MRISDRKLKACLKRHLFMQRHVFSLRVLLVISALLIVVPDLIWGDYTASQFVQWAGGLIPVAAVFLICMVTVNHVDRLTAWMFAPEGIWKLTPDQRSEVDQCVTDLRAMKSSSR